MRFYWLRLFGIGMMVIANLGAFAHAGRAANALSSANEQTGYVYTLTNDGQKNGVVVLARNSDGSLTEIAGSPFYTGGKGLVVPTGGDFDAQGALRIHGKHLIAINPGSNTIAVLNILDGGKLEPVDGSPFASGGVTPLSVAVHDDLAYVANQAVDFVHPNRKPNITGFRISADGKLTPIPGSTIEFTRGQGPAQVEFSPKGGVLAVTEGFQVDGRIHSYTVQPNGLLKEAVGSPFVSRGVSGTVGFSWTKDGEHLLVSNFRGSAVTVFGVDGKTGAIRMKGMPYANNQGAACWTALSPSGDTLYTANFVSNSISAYAVKPDGTLNLIGSAPRRKATGNDTKDIEVSPDGKYLYAVGPLARQIAVFAIGADRLPKELSAEQSPFMLRTGQWTTGLAVN
jgi:6-phosphogluconolactonase